MKREDGVKFNVLSHVYFKILTRTDNDNLNKIFSGEVFSLL